jgi:hypothetical protein
MSEQDPLRIFFEMNDGRFYQDSFWIVFRILSGITERILSRFHQNLVKIVLEIFVQGSCQDL